MLFWMMRAKTVALSGSYSSMSREQQKFAIGKKNMPVHASQKSLVSFFFLHGEYLVKRFTACFLYT